MAELSPTASAALRLLAIGKTVILLTLSLYPY